MEIHNVRISKMFHLLLSSSDLLFFIFILVLLKIYVIYIKNVGNSESKRLNCEHEPKKTFYKNDTLAVMENKRAIQEYKLCCV